MEKILFSGGSIPKYYDECLGPMFFEPYAIDMADEVSKLHPESILELACGTGRVTKHLAKVLETDTVATITDVNPDMLKFARESLGGIFKAGKVEWAVMDACEIPIKEEKFDCIICQFGAMFFPNKLKAYTDIYKILKPGGIFVFNVWDDFQYNPIAKLTQGIIEDIIPIDTPQFYFTPFSYHQEEIIRRDLALAGFNDIRIEVKSKLGYAINPQAAAKGLIEGSPVYNVILERGEEFIDEIKKKLVTYITARFGPGEIFVPLQAKIITAIKK